MPVPSGPTPPDPLPDGAPAGETPGVARTPPPPVAAVVEFVACINRGDLEGLVALMTEDHELQIEGAAPLRGPGRNRAGWAGYFSAYPDYVIHPEQIAERDGTVAVLGATTGSHLGLPDGEERALRLIWLAEVDGGRLRYWRLCDDEPHRRVELGLAAGAAG